MILPPKLYIFKPKNFSKFINKQLYSTILIEEYGFLSDSGEFPVLVF